MLGTSDVRSVGSEYFVTAVMCCENVVLDQGSPAPCAGGNTCAAPIFRHVSSEDLDWREARVTPDFRWSGI